jgi:hypothetical protein
MGNTMTEDGKPRLVLRELPGVMDIERRLALPNANWTPENDDLDERCDILSMRYFGVTEKNTMFEWPELDLDDEAGDAAARKACAAWETHFEFLYHSFEQTAVIWAAGGCDVTDGEGEPMQSLYKFGRQIIAALRELLPDARLPTAEDVTGPPKLTDLEIEKGLAGWEQQLAEEAGRFRRDKNRPSPGIFG